MTIFDSVVKYTEDILGICLNCPFEFRVCFIERVKVSQDFVYGCFLWKPALFGYLRVRTLVVSSLRWSFLNKEVRRCQDDSVTSCLVGELIEHPCMFCMLENPGNANQMKPVGDPNLEPIDSPPFDDPAELCIHESDIPKGCFEPKNTLIWVKYSW